MSAHPSSGSAFAPFQALRPVSPTVIIKDKWLPEGLLPHFSTFAPKSHLGQAVRDILRFLPAEAKEAAGELIDRLTSCLVIESALYAEWRESPNGRILYPMTLQSRKVVTTVGAAFLVDAWQNLVELEIMKYHALGTGSGAEAVGDTGLGTELTTEYTGNIRATGSLTEGASGNIFRSLGSNTLDGTPGANVREHALMSQAATGGGVCFDRSLLAGSGFPLVSGNSFSTQYDWTCNTGG